MAGFFISTMSSRCTHEEFLAKLNKKNPNRDWEILGIYQKSKEPILVRDNYGECLMRPESMLAGDNPSITSSIDKNAYCINKMTENLDTDYDYSKVNYINQKVKVEILCKKHGSFWQTPDSHKKGHGCPKCSRESVVLTKNEMLKTLEKNNFDNSIVSISKYKGSLSILSVECSNGHKYNNTYASRVYQKSGCPHCHQLYLYVSNNIEITESINILFYILKLYNKEEYFYKIGITKNIIKRIKDIKSKSSYKVEIVYQTKLPLKEAYDNEQRFKQKYIKFKKYIEETFSGHSECFKNSLPIKEIIDKLKQS